METSTPLVRLSTGARRVSFSAKNVPQLTPLRRDKQNRRTSVFNESNDDMERAERRRSAALRRSIVAVAPAVNTSTSANQNDSIALLSYEDLKTQLQIFCKLDSENKINVRNAWNLRVIDVLKEIVSKSNNPDILKIAANSLEIAGKVYGLRVDDLHAEGYKLAGTLARNFASLAQEEEESDENQDPNANAGNEENRRKKKQQKKKRPIFSTDKKHTVNSDPKAFMKPLTKLESAAFSTRTDTTLSMTGNLLTNRVRMDPVGYKFMFGSHEKSWAWIAGNDPSVKANKKFPIQVPSVENSKLCAAFKDFRMDMWDPDRENQELQTSRLERNSNVLGDVVLDDNGIPIVELDGPLHDIFDERDNDDGMDDAPLEEEVIAPLVHQGLEHIVDFRPTEQGLAHSLEKSAYSFNSIRDTSSGKIDQIWAGPGHWKLKFIRRSEMVYSGQDRQEQAKTKKRGPKKKNEPILLKVANLKPPKDFSKAPKKPYKTKNCLLDASKLKVPLLESSCLKFLENIEFFITVPTLRPEKKNTQTEVDYRVSEYNYNNPEDRGYCPQQLANDDNGADMDDDNGDHFSPSPTGEHNSMALVDLPEMVHKTFMHYATKAKQIDMKKLKRAVWCTLTRKEEYDPSSTVIPTTFQELYKQLPKLLPEKMATDLSAPLAFVALLHLCNEQSLALKTRDLSDFDIIGPEMTLLGF